MRKLFLMPMSLLLLLGMVACEPKNPAEEDINGTNDGPTKELSVDEQKDYFDESVRVVLGYFNTEDQKHAIEMADHFSEEFAEHEWDFEEVMDFFESHYDVLFSEPAYVCGLMKMQSSVSSNPIYTFSFANDAMTFEANTATRIVKNLGKSKDGKYTVILRDGSTTLTAQAWPEGKETSYLVNYSEFGGEDKLVEGKLPEKIHFSFKENDTELISFVVNFDIVKDKHAITSVDAKITTLFFHMDENFNSTSGEFAMSFKNNENVIFAMSTIIPSFPVLIKKGNYTWEQWFEQYGEQWESLVKQAEGATFTINIGDRVQIKGSGEEGGKLYTELMKILESDDNEKTFWRKMAAAINDHADCGMYFNSDKKQADIKMDVVLKDDYYLALPLLYFSDGSSYDISSYFMESSVYENYMRQVDNLLVDYENLFKYWDLNFRLTD